MENHNRAITELEAYEVLEHRFLEDLQSEGYLLRHKKSGARISLLANNDDNKVFYIGFRTPPEDSTGVAHIIEHTVLCGSRDFPVKDPFIELVKGSLNTFLNAMTYPDKTVYPVASCNETDFKNLMHVYLDAVFYPRIYQERRIFEQEGWHYEAESDESPVTINGVVYNEMKGALSSPDDLLSREIFTSLYPDTTYAVESGGDPENIPDLTYEAYLDFHRRYYHPSNSYIYLYGDMDMAERLTYLDEKYLSHFDAIPVPSQIGIQPPFAAPVEASRAYSIMEDEEEAGNAYLSFNVALADCLDAKLNVAFKVLDYCLCEAPGAPVKEALLHAGIGRDVYSIFENGIRQPCFSVIARYADTEQKEAFVETIRRVLSEIVEKGFDRKALAAGLNYYEFRFREADYGSYPKGLVYGLQSLDSWLYDERLPWLNLELGSVFAQLKEEADSGYFEKLIETWILNNPHCSVLVLEPEKGLTGKKEAALAARIDAYVAGLTQQERAQITERTRLLRQFQQTPETQEDLQKIPLLTLADLKREAPGYVNEPGEAGAVPFVGHPLQTNGIYYLTLLFDLKGLPQEYYRYLGVFRAVFGMLSTERYSYAALNNEIHIETGGMAESVSTYTQAHDLTQYRAFLEISTKTLPDHLEQTFALLEEILLHTRYEDAGRVREVLEEERSGMKSELLAAGHVTAATRALSYQSGTAALMDMVNGIAQYRTVCDLLDRYDEEKETLCGILRAMAGIIFRKENLLADCTAQSGELEKIKPYFAALAERLSAEPAEGEKFSVPLVKKNEGFATAGQVQYVCRAGNFVTKGLPYTGALRVLKVMMGYDYLWNVVRVKGGAYGCMCSFGRDGASYFVSYRDPHLMQTVGAFLDAPAYVRGFEADERTMTQYVIGAVSALDHPMSPAAYGRYSLAGYLTGFSEEEVQKERDEVLDATPEKIRALAEYLDAFLEDGCFCVVGSAAKIEENRDRFGTVEKIQ
ncbi:MAG: insulinase family protein [Eubacteriales bacterium]|nr:insulinase family protein [Eubacteriales bacterium]